MGRTEWAFSNALRWGIILRNHLLSGTGFAGVVRPSMPLILICRFYFSADMIADWIFGKFHNGFLKATLAPPFDRLFIVPRREAIRQLAEKYPKCLPPIFVLLGVL